MSGSPQNITRDNHYLPEFLLRQWASEGKIFLYRILVSAPTVREWQQKPTSSVGFRDDLYTLFSGGREVDEFEKWTQAIETPAATSIHKLTAGSKLTPQDWCNIIRLVALQDLRTPQGFLELRKLWDRIIPDALNKSMEEAIEYLESAHARGERLPERTEGPDPIGRLVRIEIEPPNQPGSDKAKIRATVPSGRHLWLETVRNLMEHGAKVLFTHRWSVAAPFGDLQWPLPDHPVLRLNWNSESDYNFGGGWNSPGTEIMMPLSPQHLLYVKVGAKMRNRFAFGQKATQLLQRLLAERAHRFIFATRNEEWVATARPRTVDVEAMAAEDQAWREWHQDQLASEIALEQRPALLRRQPNGDL